MLSTMSTKPKHSSFVCNLSVHISKVLLSACQLPQMIPLVEYFHFPKACWDPASKHEEDLRE